MPNHITNRIELRGNGIDEMIKKFSTFYPEKLNRTYDDSQVICQDKNGQFVGWYDDKNDLFQYAIDRNNDKKVKGLPDDINYKYRKAFVQMPDFQKIIPCPEIIKNTVFHTGIITRAKNAVGFNVHDNELISGIEKTNRIKSCFEEIKTKDIPDLLKAIQCFYETGYFYWYDWNIANWGTKWNSYNCKNPGYGIYFFDTAWSGVPDIICKMSKEFSKIEIDYKYADEDSGSNVGDMTIKAGDCIENRSPENGSNEAYGIYLSLNPDCDCIKKIDGKYQYVEDEE